MRKVLNINSGWKFIQKNVSETEVLTQKAKKVNLPHTWNNLDGQDGGGDYYRGGCWYYKKLGKVEKAEDEVVYLEFQGVQSIADIYFNGKQVGHHEGGFSTFRCRVDELLNEENIIMVKADNSANDRVYPQWADFTFFGGIYRDVNLITTNITHFDLDYFGSKGVKVTPKLVKDTWVVEVDTYLTNGHGAKLIYTLKDKDGNTVLVGYEDKPSFKFEISKPHLWNGVKDPFTYTLEIKLAREDKVLDDVSVTFGLRTFKIDPKKGFFLNGESYPLHGVSRHQDRFNKGWAISKKDHKQDIELIKEVGANTIRLAHYQHDQYFYDLCDEVGMVVWAEIPYISMDLANGHENARSQMQELVYQNYNHPSIVVWGLSNEISMGGETPELIEKHKDLNNLVHSIDKTRLTTMAQVSMLDIDSEMNQISDVISYNHYFGWYGGEVGDNAVWFDNFHKKYPKICFGVSEYGCECVLNWHTSNPEMGDYSEEYQCYYHHNMLETFAARPYLWATHVWNMFDFAADSRDEGGVKGRNDKGLVTYDRKIKKDSFYLYKAYWSEEPFIHLASKRYVYRCEEESKVIVYSNQKEVSLFVNGKLLETKTGEHVFEFKVKLEGKKTKLVATSGKLKDKSKIVKVETPYKEYSLDAKTGSVTNWFDKDGNNIGGEINRDYFSIKDKIKDIMANPEGKKLIDSFIERMVSSLSKDGGMEIPKGAMKMMGGFSIERIAKMLSDKIPAEVVVEINTELQKIKK
jgi:beta-galactosidase